MEKVLQLAKEFNVKRICIFDEQAGKELSKELGFPVLTGIEGLRELASEPEVDIVIERSEWRCGLLTHTICNRTSKHVMQRNDGDGWPRYSRCVKKQS